MDKEQEENLAKAIFALEKLYKREVLFSLDGKGVDIKAISTGSLLLDIATGTGGYGEGKISELSGGESNWKSTLAYLAMAKVQKNEGLAVLIDAENAFSPLYGMKCGMILSKDRFLISQPDTLEEAIDTIDYLARSRTVKFIVVDSVPSLVPKDELEDSFVESSDRIAIHARTFGKGLRRLIASLEDGRCSLLFINQLREKIGVMWGAKEDTPGGRALKFWSHLRVRVKSIETLKQGNQVVGNRVKATCIKNKCAPPHKEAEYNCYYDLENVPSIGIDIFREVFEFAISKEIIKKVSEQKYSLGKEVLQGRGEESVLENLRKNNDLIEILKKEILAVWNFPWQFDYI